MCSRSTGALTNCVAIALVVPKSILGVLTGDGCSGLLTRVLAGLEAVGVIEMLVEVGIVE